MFVRFSWLGVDFQQSVRRATIFSFSQIPTIALLSAALALPFVLRAATTGQDTALYDDPVKILMMGLVYYATIIGGFRSALHSLWTLSKERAVLRAVTEKAKALAGTGLELDPRDGGNVFLHFDTPIAADDRLASVRMVQRIWLQACEMRYEPAGIITTSYYSELSAGTRSLRSWQAVGIRLGILGTFIGLLAILGALAAGLNKAGTVSDSGALFTLVSQITDKLALAFGTSVAGLGAAVLLQIELELIVRQQEAAVSRVFEAAVRDVQHTCSLGTLRRSLLGSVDALNASIAKHAEHMSAQRDILGQGFKELHDHIAEERSGVGKRVQELSSATAAMREQVTAANSINQAYKLVIDSISAFRDSVDAALRNHVTSTSETLTKSGNDILAAINRLTGAVEQKAAADVLETLERINKTLLRIERREKWSWLRMMLVVVAAIVLTLILFGGGLLYGRPDLLRWATDQLLRG